MPFTRSCTLSVSLLALAAILSACSPRPNGASGGGSPSGTLPQLPPDFDAGMVPARLVITPLTRFEMRPAGGGASGESGVLVVHAQVLDRFDHAGKHLGVFRIFLDPPDATGGHAQTRWEVEAVDAQQNAALFDDLITRSYVFRLTELPEWAAAWAADAGQARGTVPLRAEFVSPVPGRAVLEADRRVPHP